MDSLSARTNGVFLYDEPTIEKLKACIFFWKNVVVFESYLSEVVENPDLIDISYLLFKKGILKISQTPNGLKSALYDKIYYSLDENLKEYIYRNAEKITIEPKLPENIEEIIKESTQRDKNNPDLKLLVDQIVRMRIENKWLNALLNSERFPFELMPEETKKYLLLKIKKIVDLEYKHYENRNQGIRYGFEWRNRYLLEQSSVSSALFSRSEWLPYYYYKLGNYSVKDARRYLNGLSGVMPFVKRDSLESFSLDDILKIRRNRRWNNAMDRLAKLCNEIKIESNTEQFRKEMQEKVISEYQDALGEEELTWKGLAKQMSKGSIFTGISLIPIVGNVLSSVTGLLDPLVSHFWKEETQRNLPFFLNDLKKMPILK